MFSRISRSRSKSSESTRQYNIDSSGATWHDPTLTVKSPSDHDTDLRSWKSAGTSTPRALASKGARDEVAHNLCNDGEKRPSEATSEETMAASDGDDADRRGSEDIAMSDADDHASLKAMSMKVRLSFRTDIGGMSENQDNCFIWRHEASGSFVMGVLDGHGRDVGRLAAYVVQAFMQDWLTRRWGDVKRNPAEAFRTLFADAHAAMLTSFREHLQAQGWTVKDNGGYLMKRRNMTQPWSCVHGGTSGTLVGLLEGKTLLTANVGDSSALMALQGRRLEVEDLVQHSLWKDGGGILEPCRETGTVGDPQIEPSSPEEGYPCQTMLLSADHSPESVREFERMRLTHPANQSMQSVQGGKKSNGGPISKSRLPRLLVVYDSPTSNKMKCNSVFEVDFTGKPRVTGKGRYYKNVRKEWASLVATPQNARFQDALAFTRSIGDFHLQTYGVSHVPDVMSLDLQQIFHREHEGDVPETMLVCLVTASDGVWDNWLYTDVSAFFLDKKRVDEVLETNSAERVTAAFMKENARRANANFGSQADNSTCVVCYLVVTADG